jgi:hypothetical protein
MTPIEFHQVFLHSGLYAQARTMGRSDHRTYDSGKQQSLSIFDSARG